MRISDISSTPRRFLLARLLGKLGIPWGMKSILSAGTPCTSRKSSPPRWLITIKRLESRVTSSMTRRWSTVGSPRTVCSVVTIGIRTSLSRARMWLPALPPKMPYSCWRQSTSLPLMFKKSVARRYDAGSLSAISKRTRSP